MLLAGRARAARAPHCYTPAPSPALAQAMHLTDFRDMAREAINAAPKAEEGKEASPDELERQVGGRGMPGRWAPPGLACSCMGSAWHGYGMAWAWHSIGVAAWQAGRGI